jgi:hypothetical protein
MLRYERFELHKANIEFYDVISAFGLDHTFLPVNTNAERRVTPVNTQRSIPTEFEPIHHRHAGRSSTTCELQTDPSLRETVDFKKNKWLSQQVNTTKRIQRAAIADSRPARRPRTILVTLLCMLTVIMRKKKIHLVPGTQK